MNLPWHNFHFVGIGGIGMSGLANILLDAGYTVTGSDLGVNYLVKRLKDKGGKIYTGHKAEHVNGAEVVVYSSAIGPDNPELNVARQKGLPLLSRGDLLAIIMQRKKGIAVAGTHGKTTTSAMIATVLKKTGWDPAVVVGGCINEEGINAWLGKGEYLVAEADESDGSFLKLNPYIAVITNVEPDHLDYYQTKESIIAAFKRFIKGVFPYGKIIFWGGDDVLSTIVKENSVPWLSYGIGEGYDIEARNLSLDNQGTQFELYLREKFRGTVRLSVPGRHNVLNALAAIAVADVLGIDLKKTTLVLESFQGVSRRLEVKGEKGGILVLDDYGHHPTEIKATLEAIKQKWPHRRLITIFQPHRYTRTKALYHDFINAFEMSDELIITEIYSACEAPIKGVTGKWLAEGIARNRIVYYCPNFDDILKRLEVMLRQGDIVLTLGAGDVYRVGETLLR